MDTSSLDIMSQVAAAAAVATLAVNNNNNNIPMLPLGGGGGGGGGGTKRKNQSEPKGVRGRRDTFIQQLSAMVTENKFPHLVQWNENGSAVIILDKSLFEQQVLSHYYTHQNMSSFIRQLNNHNFKTSSNHGKDFTQFSHPQFRRDSPEQWNNIRRKIQQGGAGGGGCDNEDVVMCGGGGGGGKASAESCGHCDAKFQQYELKLRELEERVVKRMRMEYEPQIKHLGNELSAALSAHNMILSVMVQNKSTAVVAGSSLPALPPPPPKDQSWQFNENPLPLLGPLLPLAPQ